MTTQIGRISGPLLKDNLLRDGVDLAFETDLLYLDVNNNKIGVRTDAPTRELLVPNIINTTNVMVDNLATVASNLSISNTSTVSTIFGDLIFDNDVVATRLGVGDLEFDNGSITNQTTNTDIELRPDGIGKVKIFNDLNVYGNLHSTGDINVDGDLIIGTDSNDVIIFNSDIDSNIIPDQTNTYKIGDNGRRWNNLYAGLLNGTVLTVDIIVPGSGTLPATRQGNIWYVSANGKDTNVGNHQNGSFATLEKALSVAGSGDTVFVYPGVYEELLPLVVPEGVSIKGMDIRNTIIKPDTASTNEDVFLLNGQSTISDITIKDFYYDSINNKGYAFRFAPSMKVTSRSPYVQNCTVITRGSVISGSDPLGFNQGDAGKGVYLDGAEISLDTVDITVRDTVSGSYNFISTLPTSDLTLYKNYIGYWFYKGSTKYVITNVDIFSGNLRFIWGTSVASFSAGEKITLSGPQKNPSMLFHSVTFITPGVDTLIMTNGVRVEWLNCFTYFANRGMYASSSLDFNDYINVIKVTSVAAGTNEYTLLGLVNGKPSYAYIYPGIGLYCQWLGSYWQLNVTLTETWRSNSNTFYPWEASNWYEVTSTGNPAPTIVLHENINIGAEVRSIGSANVYGNYGAEADGADTLMYLINHNFAYIGVGKDTTNDKTLAIQANEITELNTGKIYYTSMDHKGNFRVGDTFYVDLEKGKTSIDISALDANDIVGINFVDGNDITFVSTTKFETGNIRFQGNTISSFNGPVNIVSASGEINLNQDINIAKTLTIDNDLNIDGTLTLGDNPFDNIIILPKIDENVEPKVNNIYNLGSQEKNWSALSIREAYISDIKIDTNYITTTISNADLELRANGTGSVFLEDIKINQRDIYTTSGNISIVPATTLDVTGNTTANGAVRTTGNLVLDSNTTFGLSSAQNVNFRALVNTDILPDIANERSLGNTTQSWNLYTSQILLDDIEIQDNYIRTTVSNLNLELRANGTGAVRIEQVDFNENVIRTTGTNNLVIDPGSTLDVYANTNVNGSLNVTNNFNFNGSITFGGIGNVVQVVSQINSDMIPDIGDTYNIGSLTKRWKSIAVADAQIDDIEIFTNYIRTISSNADLELYGQGTGGVLTESLRFRNNIIEASGVNQTIQIDLAGSSILDINTNTALRLPRGPTTTMSTGGIRFNTSDNLFSGQATARTTFGGVYSENRLTFARAEPISNILTFRIGATTAMSAVSTGLIIAGLNVDDVSINNNTISTNNINLVLDPDASNTVDIDDIRFDDNLITNLSNNPITITHTGNGYLKFGGTLGIRMPAGDNSQRPGTPAQGTTRWNTEEGYMEIYVNGNWQIATASGSGFASLNDIVELGDVWTLILG